MHGEKRVGEARERARVPRTYVESLEAVCAAHAGGDDMGDGRALLKSSL